MEIDEKLIQYAKTEKQKEKIKAVIEHGSNLAAARALGINESGIRQVLKKVKKYAARDGYAPESGIEYKIPDGYGMKGGTVHRKNGEVVQDWIKFDERKRKDDQALIDIVVSAVSSYKDVVSQVPAPIVTNDELLTTYVIGDAHLGMYAWVNETLDENWDLNIAMKYLYAAIDRAISSSPQSKECIILSLGDFFHIDNNDGLTPKSKNRLDFDGRTGKIYAKGVTLMMYAIKKALEKHEIVHVQCLQGNHDVVLSSTLAAALHAIYEDHVRVKVDTSQCLFHFHEFGKVLIGMAHGDVPRKLEAFKDIMTDRAEMWGRTKYRYWLLGHVHHIQKKEFNGVVMESFRSLIPKDKYHTDHGYRSGRDLSVIVYHREFGEYERHTIPVALLAKDLAEDGQKEMVT